MFERVNNFKYYFGTNLNSIDGNHEEPKNKMYHIGEQIFEVVIEEFKRTIILAKLVILYAREI